MGPLPEISTFSIWVIVTLVAVGFVSLLTLAGYGAIYLLDHLAWMP